MNRDSAGTDSKRRASLGDMSRPTLRRDSLRARFALALVVLGVSSWLLFGALREGTPGATLASGPEAAGGSSERSTDVDPEVDLARAEELREGGRGDEARALLEGVLAVRPQHGEARHRLGLLLMEGGELEGAEMQLALAADSEPENAEFVFALARVVGHQAARSENPFAQLSLGTRSKELLDLAIELDPTLVEARLGRILFHLIAPALLGGGIERARAEVLAIAELDERTGLFAEGWLAEEERDWARAEELHRRALALDPSYARARFRLGYLVLGQERWTEALAEFEAARELEPRDPRSHEGRARALLGLGDVEGAIASHSSALELDPDFRAAIFGLGESFATRGNADDRERARERFARYLELEDEGEGADEARAWLAKLAGH